MTRLLTNQLVADNNGRAVIKSISRLHYFFIISLRNSRICCIVKVRLCYSTIWLYIANWLRWFHLRSAKSPLIFVLHGTFHDKPGKSLETSQTRAWFDLKKFLKIGWKYKSASIVFWIGTDAHNQKVIIKLSARALNCKNGQYKV